MVLNIGVASPFTAERNVGKLHDAVVVVHIRGRVLLQARHDESLYLAQEKDPIHDDHGDVFRLWCGHDRFLEY